MRSHPQFSPVKLSPEKLAELKDRVLFAIVMDDTSIVPEITALTVMQRCQLWSVVSDSDRKALIALTQRKGGDRHVA